MNNDGRPDIVVANNGASNIGVLFGTDRERFIPQRTFSTGSGS